jgi:adenylate cyclase
MFTTVSFLDVLEGRVPASTFHDKIVFIGLLGTAGFADDFWTPVSTSATGKMAGVEIHVNAAATLMRGAFLNPESRAATIATIFVLALAVALITAWRGILAGLLAVLGLWVGYVMIAAALFDQGRMLNLVYPPMALALTHWTLATYRARWPRA